MILKNLIENIKKMPKHFLVTILMLFLIWYITGCDSCKPSKQNFALIGYWDVPADETFTITEEIPIDQTVDFIARVYYPSYDEEALQTVIDGGEPDLYGIEVAEGEHPIVVFGHGQYGGGYPNNYKGMTNLMNHLASWGYVCISVNLDVLQGYWGNYQSGIPQRGELMLHGLDYLIGLDGDAASIFHDKLDEDKIGLIGHSRGGGGVVSAVNQNLNEPDPRSILSVATISPVNFSVNPVQGAVPHLSLYGTWDGDLYKGYGINLWTAGSRASDKVFVEIYGANHFHFTDAINYGSETEEILREEHHELSQGFINAFFDKYVRGLDRYTWPQYLTGIERISDVDYFIQYLSHDYEPIDDGSPLGTVDENNLTGNNDGSSLDLFEDKMLDDNNDHFYNESEGLIMHWDASGDQVVFDFPVHNASAYSYLCFRVSQRPDFDINQLDMYKNFSVSVRDAADNTSTIQIQDYQGGLQYPDFSQSIQDKVDADPDHQSAFYQYKSVLRSYRIPFADFAGVDFSQVNQVSFIFDQPDAVGFDNQTGAIAVDDLEFSN